jgi:hypothetical protein
MYNNVGVGTTEKFDPENIRVAAGILFLSALKLEIHMGGSSTPRWTTNVYFILDIKRVKGLLSYRKPGSNGLLVLMCR